MAENDKKLILLKLYEYLLKETDEKHPISRRELARQMSDQGIACHIRTISRDIALLNESGYEIISFMKDRERYYYVPELEFSIPELKIMMDAVHGANFVTEKKTADLTDKIANLGGSHRKALLKRSMKDFNAHKHSNESILYSVDSIEEALNKKKKISFYYSDLNEKAERVFRKRESGEIRRYTVDPIALIVSDDNYYLITYNERYPGSTANYRVDRMDRVEAVEASEQSKEAAEMVSVVKNYTRQSFKMQGGELTKVTLHFNRGILGPIFDQFGEKMRVKVVDENTLSITVMLRAAKTFYGWLAQFGDEIRIVEPRELRESYKEHISSILAAIGEKHQ